MAARTGYQLRAIRFNHIRGFTDAQVDLSRESVVLVGPNNAGKTSVLRVLDWIFNGADEGVLRGERPFDAATRELLAPARDVGLKARRITLEVHVPDGRHANRFGADGKVVSLRFRLWSDRVTVRTGRIERSEKAESTPLGLEFLRNLREQYDVLYIAASRSAGGDGFQELLREQMSRRLKTKFQTGAAGGAPGNELKSLQSGAKAVKQVAEKQLGSLWKDLDAWLPAALRSAGAFEVDVAVADLERLALEKSIGKLSTGDHDAQRVPIQEVGAGHQSLLWLGLALLRPEDSRRRILLVEEPESFLHPSVQRQVARALFDTPNVTSIISTHSPVVVDEAVAPEVMLVRDHKVYSIGDVDAKRAEIHTALMSGAGAEAIFSSSVLLVEGPGDRAFFERFRRRLGELGIPAHVLGAMFVVSVGGNTRFGPWLTIFEAYAPAGEMGPISWLLAADSCDAVAEVLQGVKAASATLDASAETLARAIPQITENNSPTLENVVAATRSFNASAAAGGADVRFLPIDLEYSMLLAVKPKTTKSLAADVGIKASDVGDLMSKLGSKGGTGSRANGSKADWQRDRIAAALPWTEVAPDVREILWSWVSAAAVQLGATVARPKELEAAELPTVPSATPDVAAIADVVVSTDVPVGDGDSAAGADGQASADTQPVSEASIMLIDEVGTGPVVEGPEQANGLDLPGGESSAGEAA